MNSKNFVTDSFNNNPKRYGTDDGDLHIVNDYFAKRGWQTFTREQFAKMASLIRTRNKFLQDNPDYDLRKTKLPPLFVQLSIYDFLDNGTAAQTKRLVRYFADDEERVKQSSRRIKNNVSGVDNEHITATKVMLPLLIKEPELKKIKRPRNARNDEVLGDVSGVNS